MSETEKLFGESSPRDRDDDANLGKANTTRSWVPLNASRGSLQHNVVATRIVNDKENVLGNCSLRLESR